MDRINSELIEFIHSSPTAFHTVNNAVTQLIEDGYTELYESEIWSLDEGGKYFVRRGDSSLIAFRIPESDFDGYQIVASHTDSPCFKLKPSFELVDKSYLRVSADRYGGPVLTTWLDRPLSVAGRLTVREGTRVVTKLVSTDTPVAIIPSLAPHVNPNRDAPLSMTSDMIALLDTLDGKGTLLENLAESVDVSEEDVISHDLYLVNRQKGYTWGFDEAFITSPRLDDLQCVFSSLKGFLLSSDEENVPVLALFDREEVGSGSAEGGDSDFLPVVLERITASVGGTRSEHLRRLSNSFFISADNAHGVHPNHPEASDANNRGALNSGIAIKHNAMGNYVTNAESEAVIKILCETSDIPYFDYTNRSGMPGGSTLGHYLQSQLSVSAVDIGLPQLAMHSACETAGAKDTEYAVNLFTAFYNSHIYKIGNTLSVEQ